MCIVQFVCKVNQTKKATNFFFFNLRCGVRFSKIYKNGMEWKRPGGGESLRSGLIKLSKNDNNYFRSIGTMRAGNGVYGIRKSTDRYGFPIQYVLLFSYSVLFIAIGFSKIENLEPYTGLKALWLENNCISDMGGLENQTELTCLYLNNNAIKKIEHLDTLVKLDTINLCHNFISRIENVGEFGRLPDPRPDGRYLF